MDKAEQIVEAIEKDFTDRCGLRQQWEEIDAEMQAEIKAEWVRLARGVILQ